jgi:hypothetical protein
MLVTEALMSAGLPRLLRGVTAVLLSAAASAAEPETTWKTYLNDKFGYSIRHPATTRVWSPSSASLRFDFNESFPVDGSSMSIAPYLKVEVHKNREDLSPRRWAESKLVAAENNVRERRQASLGGNIPAYRIAVWEDDETAVHYVLARDSMIYVLSHFDPGSPSLPAPTRRKYEEIFGEMVGSFRLVPADPR